MKNSRIVQWATSNLGNFFSPFSTIVSSIFNSSIESKEKKKFKTRYHKILSMETRSNRKEKTNSKFVIIKFFRWKLDREKENSI